MFDIVNKLLYWLVLFNYEHFKSVRNLQMSLCCLVDSSNISLQLFEILNYVFVWASSFNYYVYPLTGEWTSPVYRFVDPMAKHDYSNSVEKLMRMPSAPLTKPEKVVYQPVRPMSADTKESMRRDFKYVHLYPLVEHCDKQ